MADPKDPKAELKLAANAVADTLDADILVLNWEIFPPIDFYLMRFVNARKVRKRLFLILVTEGGSSDSAFRIMRALLGRYAHITVVISGWCKSAGTLMCVGAHELQFGPLGELGPLDVQIVKADEMDEEKSGLVTEAAFEKLQQETFKFFMNFVRDFGQTEYRITLRTAAEIAWHITGNVVSPIFAKLDPVTIGEDYRSNRLAHAYAERLNSQTNSLIRGEEVDALEMLLSGYKSHGFVIDREEAENLFKRVEPVCPEILDIIDKLEQDSVLPRSRRRSQSPRVEYLNDERKDPAAATAQQGSAQESPEPPKPSQLGEGAENLSRDPGSGDGAHSPTEGQGENTHAAVGLTDQSY